jgi:hypothetical protein
VIIGLEWLRLHDPNISFAGNTVTFNSDFCRRRCLQGGKPVTVVGLDKTGEQALCQRSNSKAALDTLPPQGSGKKIANLLKLKFLPASVVA